MKANILKTKSAKIVAISLASLILLGGAFWAGKKSGVETTINEFEVARAEMENEEKAYKEKPRVSDFPKMEGEFYGFDGIRARSVTVEVLGEFPHSEIYLKGYESNNDGEWSEKIKGISSIEGFVDHIAINEKGDTVSGIFNSHDKNEGTGKVSFQNREFDGEEVKFQVQEDGETMLIIFKEDTEYEQFWVCARRDKSVEVTDTQEYIKKKAKATDLI